MNLKSFYAFFESLDEFMPLAMEKDKPGSILGFPYLIVLRLLILGGAIIRFFPNIKSGNSITIVLISFLFLLFAMSWWQISSKIKFLSQYKTRKRVHLFIILGDISLFSMLYAATGDYDSNIYLFYCLPLLATSEYFKGIKILTLITLYISFAFLSTIVFLTGTSINFLYIFINIFLPREIFFICILLLPSYRHQLDRQRKELLIKQANDLNEQKNIIRNHKNNIELLLNFRGNISQVFNKDKVLKGIIQLIKDIFNAKFSYICIFNIDIKNSLKRYAFPPTILNSPYLSELENLLYQNMDSIKGIITLNNAQINAIFQKILSGKVGSCLWVPIKSHDHIIGAIFLGHEQIAAFDDASEQLLRSMPSIIANAIERENLIMAIHDINGVINNVSMLNIKLNILLNQLIDKQGFEFACISIVDEYRNLIYMIRGNNIPPAWYRYSIRLIGGGDILDFVRESKITQVIAGWDSRLDKETFERFNHANIARIYAPLIDTDGTCTGIIQAGCDINNRQFLDNPNKINSISKLGNEFGPIISQLRPHILFESVAAHAMKIIGADSASLHIFKNDVEILTSAVGPAKNILLTHHRLGNVDLARILLNRNSANIMNEDPNILLLEQPELYNEGIRSYASFSFSTNSGAKGILFLFYLRKHNFSEAELQIAHVFCTQVAILIRNYLLLENISDSNENAHMLLRIQNEIAKKLGSKDLLNSVAQNAIDVTDSNIVVLYPYNSKLSIFSSNPIIKGKLFYPNCMAGYVNAEHILFNIIKHSSQYPQFINNVFDYPLLCNNSKYANDNPRFFKREKISSCAIIILITAGEPVGVMFVNYRTKHNFVFDEQQMLLGLANSAAIAIKNNQLFTDINSDLERRIRQNEAMQDIHNIIQTLPNIFNQEFTLYNSLLGIAKRFIPTSCAYFLLFNKFDNSLQIKAFFSNINNFNIELNNKYSISEYFPGLSFSENNITIIINDLRDNEYAAIYRPIYPNTHSLLSVPIYDISNFYGVIYFENADANAFSENDQHFMEIFSQQVLTALISQGLYNEIKRQLDPLRALGYISAIIQNSKYDLNTMLLFLLTGLTADEGGRMSRAMIFLYNKMGHYFQGTIAIGAKTKKEAQNIWDSIKLTKPKKDISSFDTLRILLENIVLRKQHLDKDNFGDFPLNAEINNIVIPANLLGAVADCLNLKSPQIISFSQPDPLRNVLLSANDNKEFGYAILCIPLLSGIQEDIKNDFPFNGLLIVDNRYLYSEQNFSESSLNICGAFAGVIEMLITNAKIKEYSEKDKLNAWQDFAASTAHIIGSQISSLERKVTSLRWSLESVFENNIPEPLSIHLNELYDDISESQTSINDFRTFASPTELKLETVNLQNLIQKLVNRHYANSKHKIKIILPTDTININCDISKITDSLRVLIENADEALIGSNKPHSKIVIALSAQSYSLYGHFNENKWICIDVIDNGPGINKIIRNRLFTPFYSTKGHNKGLGLYTARKYIQAHGGTIVLIPKAKSGAHFRISLPYISNT